MTHPIPVACGLAVLTLPLLAELPSPENAISLFPAEPGYKVTYNGEQGARWSVQKNHLEIRRETLRTADYSRGAAVQEELDPFALCCSFLKDADEGEKEILRDVINAVQEVEQG